MTGVRVLKGHGTENDFVLLPDLDGAIGINPARARALCDRHAGIGGDGVLRVVRSASLPEAAARGGTAEYFMDYYNSDGSIAEMCGNGARVFARYLFDEGLIGNSATIGTRGGERAVTLHTDGQVTVAMGYPELLAERPKVTAAGMPGPAVGTALTIPNPHVVVEVTAAELDELDLSAAPAVVPELPDGQNVEFVTTLGPRHLRMRVHERGSGETRSCGTGICAVVVAQGEAPGDDTTPWRVDVPGGTCLVTVRPDGEVLLTGPAVIVGEIELSAGWLHAVDS